MNTSRLKRLLVILGLSVAIGAISSAAFARSTSIFGPTFCAFGPTPAVVSAVFPPPLASEPAELLLMNRNIHHGRPAELRHQVTGRKLE